VFLIFDFYMNKTIKQVGLILGLFSLIISFLFFGREQITYQILLISGLILAMFFYITIIIGNESSKYKIGWTIFIILALIGQWLTEPIFIRNSFLIYLNNNEEDLKSANKILLKKIGEIYVLNDTIIDNGNLLKTNEKDSLVKLKQKLNVYMISKSENYIYYGLWGFLDERIGLNWFKSDSSIESYTKLKDNWYY
jgi:hypothetical protein